MVTSGDRVRVSAAVPLLLAAALSAAPPVSGEETFDAEAFHRYVEQAVSDWKATGLAVAVVRGQELLFARGYGALELGEPSAVDEDTLFAIGSTTKAMTAAALGILVDEGKLGWDDPVRRHIPEFEVGDPWVSEAMTVRDLLTHRGGLPNTDVFWYGQETGMDEMLSRLRHVDPAYSMRSGFIYQNVMYATAGEVVKRVSGMPWHDFVDSRIFDRLGMDRTVPLISLTRGRDNVASPHHVVDGETVVIENAPVDSVAAAGAVWSSVREMSLWLRMLLASGVAADGTRILSEDVVEEMFRPQSLVDRAGSIRPSTSRSPSGSPTGSAGSSRITTGTPWTSTPGASTGWWPSPDSSATRGSGSMSSGTATMWRFGTRSCCGPSMRCSDPRPAIGAPNCASSTTASPKLSRRPSTDFARRGSGGRALISIRLATPEPTATRSGARSS